MLLLGSDSERWYKVCKEGAVISEEGEKSLGCSGAVGEEVLKGGEGRSVKRVREEGTN